MNAIWKKGLGIALIFSATENTYGQMDLGKYEIGLTAGVFVYQGDLTPNPIGSYRTLRPTVNLFVNRNLNPYFSLRGSLFYGGLKGDDAAYSNPEWRQQRAFNFSSRVFELSGLLVYNPLGTDRRFYTYIFGGAGLSFLTIKRDWSGFTPDFFTHEDLASGLTDDINHNVPKVIPVIPLGAGAQYSLTTKISIVAETSYRLTRTDYLDGFSKAANPDLYDHYQSHTIGIVYKFGKRSNLDCPKVQ